MISQAILVAMMVFLDTGRCWESMPMPAFPTRCGDQAIPFPFRTSPDYNLDRSSIVTCNYSYNPPKLLPDMSSINVSADILHDRNCNVAIDYYFGSQVNNSAMSEATLCRFSTPGPKISYSSPYSWRANKGLSGFLTSFKDNLEWPVPNLTCHEARKNSSSFECRATNSECVDSRDGAGYHCTCAMGFEGDPYLVDGCRHDVEGGGKKDGSGYYPQRETNRFILFYILLGFVIPSFAVSWIFWQCRRKKVVNLRRSLFSRNGGELLQAKQSIQKTLIILTAEDLKKATNNYDESNVLSQEHHLGITYKGILPGTNSGVTIQFCHAFDRCKIEALVTKLVTLSQVSHRNVVRLLGCCLETQIPLLVYESITCKTLFDHINDDYLSWDIRLRIAADTAGALAYLHSATIIHGALSSSCILLDHDYNVKLKGFDLKCLNCPCVEPYPDLFSSGQLTEKSDVYSFGFILLEMLTQKGVMSLEEEEKLAKCISGTNRDDELLEILDDSIVTDDNAGKLREVAEIAKTCLSSSSHERPTMKEVALALDECIKNRD